MTKRVLRLYSSAREDIFKQRVLEMTLRCKIKSKNLPQTLKEVATRK